MNYTLIGYSEATDSTRYGDYEFTQAKFEIFHTQDKDELIQKWADWVVNKRFEEINLLLDGVPEIDQADTQFDVWQELNDAMQLKKEQLKLEIQIAKNEAELLKQRLKAYQELIDKEIQRKHDLATFETLKKKLGM